MALNPTALLIIRAWLEPASSKPLRAQIRLTTDISNGITSERTLVEISSISTQVEEWLHDFLLSSVTAAGEKRDS